VTGIPEYLVIGHVTQDQAPDGTFRVGGTATYSALAAMHLGLRVGVLTSAHPTTPLFEDQSSISVRCRPAKCTTTFENVYVAGSRQQYLRAVAEDITIADLPSGWDAVPIVHLGPVAQEVDLDLALAFPLSFLGVTPQGWLRSWDAQGLVSSVECAWADHVLSVADVVVLSLEDIGGDRQRLERIVDFAPTLVLTIGRDGAVVFHGGQERSMPAYAVSEVDPTGAGDVFATACIVRLHETSDIYEAARFANCAASFVVEGVGVSSVPSRAQVETRLRRGSLRD
jgi:1D-myo-inositol 3-kinase